LGDARCVVHCVAHSGCRAIDDKTELFAAVQNDFLLPTAQNAHFHANLGETVMVERFEVKLGQLCQNLAVGLCRADALRRFHRVFPCKKFRHENNKTNDNRNH
jgi:hypothetical protein